MVPFRRKIYSGLLDWKDRFSGEYALLIEGARRVGKTTLVKEFVKNEFRSSLFIDLGENPHNVRKILRDYSGDYDSMFQVLQTLFKTKLYPHESVIVFDEVQMFPFARQMVKYLVEYGKYPVMETGSLISLRQNVEGIVIPSEEMKLYMHPMDFEEFLWARGNDSLIPVLRGHFEDRKPLGPPLHESVMREYATYMAVGGMPQAVSKFVDGGDFESVDRVKSMILSLYEDDVMKIRGNLGAKVRAVLMQIPSQLSRHGKRFSPGDVVRDSRTRDYVSSFGWLRESGIANICYACTDPGPAPELYLDENVLKAYLLDTGLLITLAFQSNIAERGSLYEALISGDLGTNEGMLFENMVAQELAAKGIKPVFFEFSTDESVRRQEIDFLVSDGRKVIPVEVKSGRSASHRSLDRYLRKYSDRSDRAFVIHAKDLRTDGPITYIPVYMTMFI